MGFLSDFAEGFLTTSSNTITDNKKRQDEIDDARKKAVALTEPTLQLYKRQKDIDIEAKRIEQRQSNDEFANFLNRMPNDSGTNNAMPPGLDNVNPATAPTPQPSAGGFMTPTTGSQPSAAPVDDLTKVHNDLQQALKMKAAAAGAGNKQLENYFDTVVDSKKAQYTYLTDNAKKDAAPINSAEGTNIVSEIQKENDAKVKDPTGNQSDYLPKRINGLLAQPDIMDIQQQSVIKHTALAQAIADVKKQANPALSTKEVYPLIREQTKNIITGINVINSTDPRITPAEKMQAIKDIEKYTTSLTDSNPDALNQLTTNPNYAAVFDDQTVQNINAILGSGEQQPSPSTTSTPKGSIPEGATATNKKTGERKVYRNGKWQPL